MDKNYNPLNPMVDQVKQFLDQKQIPKDQVVPFLMSLGYRGLAGAVAGRMRLDQASEGIKAIQQTQGQSPAPPNVMQENAMKTQQLQQGIQQALGSRNPMMTQAAPNIRAAASGGLMKLAGGGPIAFQKGGLSGIDFSKMSEEQLEMLAGGNDVALARAALGEKVRRSGYPTPRQLFDKYAAAVEAGIPKGGLFKYDPRPFPSYMYDEQGNVRKGEVTAGIAGTPMFVNSRGVSTIPAAVDTGAQASTVLNQVPESQAGAAFDAAISGARQGVRQEGAKVPTVTEGRPASTKDNEGVFAKLIKEQRERKFEELPETFSKEEMDRIKKSISGLSEDKKKAFYLALAQAGFGMAAAGSRPGATFFGALAEGAAGGVKQYNELQKDLRQTEKELNKEMSMLRRYQDEVARGERTAQRSFEERRADNVANLTAQQETLQVRLGELASAREERREARQERALERAETKGYREQTLQAELINNAIKGIDEQLKSYTLSDADRTRLQAERTRLSAQRNAMISGGRGAAGSGLDAGAITSSGW